MVGNNSMQLNEATMITIVQYWLDNKFLNKDEKSPKVVAFKRGGNTYDNNFEIELSPQDDA